MRPMLDDIELPQVQEITTLERRVLAEHKTIGMAGSLLQNMGRRPTRLALWGVVTGDDALDFIQKLDDKFRAATPVPFVADIIKDAEIEKMLIEDMKFQDLAGKPDRFAYLITLREFIEPVEPEEASLLDESILNEAQNLIDDLVGGLNIGLDFATGLEQFLPQFSDLLTRLQAFNNAGKP
jgi:hypothetical protein